jgi:predicted Rossmann fold flavoprotein
MDSICRKWLPAQMIQVFLDRTGIPAGKAGHQLTSKERRNIVLGMKDFRFTVTGHRPFQEAIITAGGVSTAEIHPTTMESKRIPLLYFAGELVDLDADTGGFNLQIAFSTGWLAANACMAALTRTDRSPQLPGPI